MKFLAPIVGMAFRPPAGRVLGELPFGAELELKRQPENPYDSNAIQVFLHGFSAEGKYSEIWKFCAADALPDDMPAGRGVFNISALTDPLFLGFIAAKTGEAAELAAIMDKNDTPSLIGILGGLLDGKPAIVEVRNDEELPAEPAQEPAEPKKIEANLDDEIPL